LQEQEKWIFDLTVGVTFYFFTADAYDFLINPFIKAFGIIVYIITLEKGATKFLSVLNTFFF
jgi:hypothetical protein